MTQSPVKIDFSEFLPLEFLREKFGNAIEISGKTQGILFLKNAATQYLLLSVQSDVNVLEYLFALL